MMPILALGLSKSRQFKPVVYGFTLLEMMVVLVVIAISFALVSPNFIKNDDDLVKEEATRLAALLEYAADSASSQGHWLAFSPTISGYRFLQHDEDKNVWQPIATDEVLRERQLPEGMSIKAANSQQALGSSLRMIALSPSGIDAPFQIELAAGKAKRLIKGNLLGKVEVLNPNLVEGLAL